jgi:antitoxin (DNA-binding transcriptional repressor) of toxin-antitoxin stability system
MKTITKQEASQGFDDIADLAHAGETVLVTHGGKPWVKLIPASKGKPGKSAAAFRTRLNRISTKPIAGVSEVFERVRS